MAFSIFPRKIFKEPVAETLTCRFAGGAGLCLAPDTAAALPHKFLQREYK